MPTVENASPADDSTPAESTGIASQDWATASASPQYRAAVVDLLGALAYGELAAFERLAEDAKLAPTLDDKAELAAMASAEFHHFEQLRDRLAKIEAEPTAAMEPFARGVDDFHRQTAPSDWLEGLVKAYVGDSIASDFYREVASHLDTDTRAWCSVCSTTPATATSPSKRCAPRSRRTRAAAAGSRCGPAA